MVEGRVAEVLLRKEISKEAQRLGFRRKDISQVMEVWMPTGALKGLWSTGHVVRKLQALRVYDLELQFDQGAIN